MWLHCHPDHEVHYITGGAFEFRLESERFLCASGTVVVLPPKCYHTIEPMVEGSTKVSFEFSLTGSGRAYEDYAAVFHSLKSAWHGSCQIPELLQLQELLRSEKTYEARYRLNTALGLGLIRIAQSLRGSQTRSELQIPLDPRCNDDADMLLAMVLNYIEDHAAERLTLEALAGEVNLSQRQVQRILREKMGDTFLSLLSHYRVLIAIRCLQNGQTDLSQVAREAGFSDRAALCRAFQQHKGITPEEYRTRLKKRI